MAAICDAAVCKAVDAQGVGAIERKRNLDKLMHLFEKINGARKHVCVCIYRTFDNRQFDKHL